MQIIDESQKFFQRAMAFLALSVQMKQKLQKFN